MGGGGGGGGGGGVASSNLFCDLFVRYFKDRHGRLSRDLRRCLCFSNNIK